jgi:hypothetical protein
MYLTPKMSDHLYVITRSGRKEPVSFDKVLTRIQTLADGLDHVNPDLVAQKVCSQIADGIKTSELDEFAAETCAMMQARHHPNYGKLAARLVIDNHQKNTRLLCASVSIGCPGRIDSFGRLHLVCLSASRCSGSYDGLFARLCL